MSTSIVLIVLIIALGIQRRRRPVLWYRLLRVAGVSISSSSWGGI
jgi:hypothetical protein